MKLGKNNIDFNSFTKKSPKKIDDNFGVFMVNGTMGSGKTYLCVYFAYNYFKGIEIRTNIHSLKIPDSTIKYFDKLDEITDDIDENILYIVDEISKKYTKGSPQDKKLYSWLQQSRKRKRYVLLITQEYLLVPQWLRGVCSYVYTTKKLRFLPIFKTIKGVPYLTEEKEWNIEPVAYYYYKRNKQIFLCN